MDKITLIHKRNILLMRIICFFYLIDTIFFTIVDQSLLLIKHPVGLGICLTLFLISRLNMNPYYVMLLNLLGFSGYVFYLNFVLPYLINYFFIIFGIIVSAFYQSYRALFISTTIAVSSLIFFADRNEEHIFRQSNADDNPYYILLAILTTILLSFMIKYANQLWVKAYSNELKAKEDLNSTKLLFESFFQNTKDAIAMLDMDSRILESNEAFKTLFGLQSDSAVGNVTELISDANGELQKYIQEAKNGTAISSVELKLVTKKSDDLIIEVTISPVFNQAKQVFAVSLIIRDVTERKKLEEYLRNSEKLKVTGEIAAGVAHEIKNPLTVISGFIQMIGERDNTYSQYFSIINSEIQRMKEIISEFLFLSKPNVAQLKPHKLKPVIDEIILLFDSEAIYKNVFIEKRVTAKIDTVLCEVNQLKQVFINLLKNSIEAMPEGGTITFECSNSRNDIIIIIEDDGVGISEEVLKKIGTPFFTTKETGTGLGLMITERIIEQHKGRLSVTSENKQGTRVQITLPAYTATESEVHDGDQQS